MQSNRNRNLLLGLYGLLTVASLFLLTRLKFSFDFEQFFPQGDPEYEFFKNYIKEFETDDNFLLVAVERREGVFDQAFLEKFHDFTVKAGELPHVTSSMSLTKMQYPLKTPFGVTAVPAVHISDTSYYATDRARVLQDQRLVHNLISEDGTALSVLLKTVDRSSLEQAEELMDALNNLLKTYQFDEVHLLGRAYFQKEMVRMEMREVAVSTVIAALLAVAILFFIFRRWWSVFIAMAGIGLALLFFLGVLSALGRELNALAALYPILMCIVGVADTIHILSKYLDELEKGHDRPTAIRITLKEIGLATFITCITTAIGFVSLLTNRTAPIQGFGVNAAIGVVTAFFVIYGWLWAMLPRFRTEQLIKFTPEYAFWGKFMAWTYRFTKSNGRKIAWVSIGLLAFCLVGISLINTNYRIKNNLPRGRQLTADFLYFEQKFSGFRPIEIAVFPQNGYKADDFEVLREMDKVENHVRSYPFVKTLASVNDLYRSLHAMNYGNQPTAYRLPDSLAEFERYQRLADKAPPSFANVLLSKNRDKARITGRMQDVGRDTVEMMQNSVENWWRANTDSSIAKFKITGTGVILDKNSAYIRDNMLQGLIPSVLIVALIMALLFKNWRMVLVFCVPNVFPLFFAGALIGYLGIPLEAGIATVFSIVFGIATDDTVHFLSNFKLCQSRGLSVEESLRVTLAETGKAMCLGSIILFFSFLVMLFSIHPPSVTVGLLVSATLAGALFCDLLLAPVLVRWLIREKKEKPVPLQEAAIV
ncbi:MAG: MMPL family transporter [Saprospiraceae bacterium]